MPLMKIMMPGKLPSGRYRGRWEGGAILECFLKIYRCQYEELEGFNSIKYHWSTIMLVLTSNLRVYNSYKLESVVRELWFVADIHRSIKQYT